ncbi:MAG: FAD-dependent oxidoreductase [Clostridia bacterium]|nr:FAD-dependent oxidoreductase [Clostridia bacterium]
MKSIWQENIDMPKFNSVNNDLDVDVLIIGGGICGILCAHMLDKKGINYALVEGGRICNKTTANTTAKITSQHGFIYNKIVKKYGLDFAKLYLDANENAILEYEKLCKDIDCDFEKTDNYVYTINDSTHLENELLALKKIGFNNFEYCESLGLPFNTCGGIKFKNQAQLNPLKFIAHIAKGLNIYENSHISEMIDTTAIVNNKYKINAKKVIVATHFPFINKHGLYFLKMYQHRSYVLALENAPLVNGMYVDEDKKGLSFRNYNNYLLLGGGSHRTGKKGGSYMELEEFAKKHFPNAKIKYKWATQDCMTLDDMPYIGNYSKSTPNLYVATGFNKWGMSSSMVASKILCDLVIDKENKYSKLFSPSRSILHGQLAINTFEALCGWLSFTKKRCPHLGCGLKWNKYEHTWDCSCHGSRFDKDGNVLNNPANENLK